MVASAPLVMMQALILLVVMAFKTLPQVSAPLITLLTARAFLLEWKVPYLLSVTWLGQLEIRFKENSVQIIQAPFSTRINCCLLRPATK